jgi:hypothetical protein
MAIHKLQKIGGDGSAGVTLPKSMLREDGVVDETGVDDSRHVQIEHLGGGRYELQFVDVE